MKIGREGKLLPNPKDKKEYVALDQVLKFKMVHQVIEFQHSKWMKAYIMLNTRLRKAAKNDFEKDFFKFMNNSAFGKTMENHKDMKLVTSDKKYLRYVMKPNFSNGFPFFKHLLAVEMGKTEIKMNKPMHLGQTLLDLSKRLMYEFHCDYMRPKYGSKVRLCYMDTDSFVYEIETEDFYRDIEKDVKKRFDTSGYSRDDKRPLPIGENKKEISLMKHELGGKIMTEFVALRAKMYAYRKIDKEVEEKRCKGTKKCVVSEGLTFDDYKTCLFDGKTIHREQMLFENKKHEVYTVNKHNIALNRDNDKRLVCNKAVEKAPWLLYNVPVHFRTLVMCSRAVEKCLHPLRFIPDHLKTQEMCEKAVDKKPHQLGVLKPKGCVKKLLKMNRKP